MLPILVGVFVAIAILISVVQTVKTAKRNKEKADAEKAMDILDEKEEFKKFLDYDSSGSSRPQQAPQRQQQSRPSTPSYYSQRQQPSRPATSTTAQTSSSRQHMTLEQQQRLEELKRLQQVRLRQAAGNNTIVTSSHHDSHCDVAHEDTRERYRVEYVPTMNSIGGNSTEGCQEHYNVRYVKLDDIASAQKELTPLQKVVVFGEVINEPAFKRGYRGRR